MSRPLPDIISLADLEAASITPPSPVIDTLFERGSKLMLVAASKANKSWCLMDMSFCVSQPMEHWWGMAVHHGRVLYINFELHQHFFRERMRDIARAYGFPKPANKHLDVWNLRGCAQDYQSLMEKIKKRFSDKKSDYVLVIIDPFYKFSSSNKVENAAQDMAQVLNAIEELAFDLDVAIAFAHHSPKGDVTERDVVDRGSGSGVFGRDPDAIVAIHQIKNGFDNHFQAGFALRYHPPKAAIGLKFTFPLMTLSEDVDVGKKGRPVKFDTLELLTLFNGTPISGPEWCRLADEKLDMPSSTFRRKRQWLVVNKRVKKLPYDMFEKVSQEVSIDLATDPLPARS